MSSKPAWGSIPANTTPPSSFADIMTEELVQKMEIEDTVKELKAAGLDNVSIKLSIAAAHGQNTDQPQSAIQKSGATAEAVTMPFPAHLAADNKETMDDFVLAQMLQKEFDEEFDRELQHQEASDTSKVNVVYSHLQRKHNNLNPGSDDDDDDRYDESSEEYEEPSPITFGRGGLSGKGPTLKSKHDADISSRKNGIKFIDTFDAQINTGDPTGMSLRLPNRVYNQLRVSSNAQMKREIRIREPGGADRATVERALDEKTKDIVFRLIQSDRLQEVTGVVSTGKEAVVLHATGGSGEGVGGVSFPAHCAVKVFKTTLTDFKNRRMYMNGDYRFGKTSLKKGQNPRKIIRMWAEKEMMNLKRIYNSGIPCPQPLFLRKHVLVMSFIGADELDVTSSSPSRHFAAPQLKECAAGSTDTPSSHLTHVEWEAAYHQVLEYMSTLYNKCSLVHADLSEYNMLWHDKKVWLIDVSQSVTVTHIHALEFLLRDCRNVSNFFSKCGVENVMEYEDHFNSLTGANIPGHGEEFMKGFTVYLSKLHDYEKDNICLDHGKERVSYPFDDFFEDVDDNAPKCSTDDENEEFSDDESESTVKSDIDPSCLPTSQQ